MPALSRAFGVGVFSHPKSPYPLLLNVEIHIDHYQLFLQDNITNYLNFIAL